MSRLLLHGHDTIECAYYLRPLPDSALNFAELAVEKETLRQAKRSEPKTVVMEYVEPGASATDDKRPVFQQLIGEATLKPSPYDIVVVHSLSRFFRDSLEFGLYERRLNKAGVKLISITQQTSDDPSGEMARKIFIDPA